MSQVQPEVVEALVSNCCNLEVVTMAGLKGVTDTVALAVARRCPEIQHISFRNCDLTDLGICEMAAGCPQLCLLAVAGVHALTDKSIMALAEHCPHLEELYISGCDKITKQAVTYLKVCVCVCVCVCVYVCVCVWEEGWSVYVCGSLHLSCHMSMH